MTSARRTAIRSVLPACQCVYQSNSGIPRGFASGAASTRKSGTMCASTASGARPPQQLGGERASELKPSPGPRGPSEDLHAHVRRQLEVPIG